jgi:hypothetical protein
MSPNEPSSTLYIVSVVSWSAPIKGRAPQGSVECKGALGSWRALQPLGFPREAAQRDPNTITSYSIVSWYCQIVVVRGTVFPRSIEVVLSVNRILFFYSFIEVAILHLLIRLYIIKLPNVPESTSTIVFLPSIVILVRNTSTILITFLIELTYYL